MIWMNAARIFAYLNTSKGKAIEKKYNNNQKTCCQQRDSGFFSSCKFIYFWKPHVLRVRVQIGLFLIEQYFGQ
jgi:hypothetical protein